MATILKEFGKLSSMMHKMYHQAAAATEQAAKLTEANIDDEEEALLDAVAEMSGSVQEAAANLQQHLINALEKRRLGQNEPQPGDQLSMEGLNSNGSNDESGKQLTA